MDLLLLLCWCAQSTVRCCDLQGKLSKPVPGVPAWTDYPPDGQGCFTDHAQNDGVKPPYVGPRLLECGMYGCSGAWGCGGAHVGSGKSKGCPKDDCPAWPTSLPKCDSAKMTPEYCSQLCFGWSQSFRYAGVTYGQECWCDVSLNTYGSAADWGAANRCVDHTDGVCKSKCKGDQNKMCGGYWAVDVYQIRPDVARAAENDEMVVFWLLFGGLPTYMLLGSLYGARRAGKPLTVRTAAQAQDLLKGHPHYSRWAELRSLVADGVHFSRAKLYGGRQRNYAPLPSAPAAETDLRPSGSKMNRSNKAGKRRKDKNASKASASSHKSKKSSKSSKTNPLEAPGPESAQLEPPQESSEEEKRRLLQEKREEGVHSSQQKIKVVGLNG